MSTFEFLPMRRMGKGTSRRLVEGRNEALQRLSTIAGAMVPLPALRAGRI